MQKIDVKELTVRQVKEVLNSLDAGSQPHIIELLFPDRVPAIVVSISTGKTLEALESDIPVSEIEDLLNRVEAKNPFFLTLLNRLATVGEQILKGS